MFEVSCSTTFTIYSCMSTSALITRASFMRTFANTFSIFQSSSCSRRVAGANCLKSDKNKKNTQIISVERLTFTFTIIIHEILCSTLITFLAYMTLFAMITFPSSKIWQTVALSRLITCPIRFRLCTLASLTFIHSSFIKSCYTLVTKIQSSVRILTVITLEAFEVRFTRTNSIFHLFQSPGTRTIVL